MTQGDPLLTTIFNVMVNAVVYHWESLIMEGAGGDNRYDISGDEATQPERRTVRARDRRQRRKEEGHTKLKVQEAF